MTIKAEQETIVRWDQEEQVAYLYTAHPAQARRWERLGYPVEVYGRDREGAPTGWEAKTPPEAVKFRPLVDGKVKKRRGHRKGKLFGAENHNGAEEHDQLVASGDQPEAG